MRTGQLALGMHNVLQELGEWLSAVPRRGLEVPLRITCCPFPSKMSAELKTQQPWLFECHTSTPPAISVITTSEGSCQYGCDLTARVGQRKLRQGIF